MLMEINERRLTTCCNGETAKKVETLKTGDERYKIEALTG
jgi:hypothetical protein